MWSVEGLMEKETPAEVGKLEKKMTDVVFDALVRRHSGIPAIRALSNGVRGMRGIGGDRTIPVELVDCYYCDYWHGIWTELKVSIVCSLCKYFQVSVSHATTTPGRWFTH